MPFHPPSAQPPLASRDTCSVNSTPNQSKYSDATIPSRNFHDRDLRIGDPCHETKTYADAVRAARQKAVFILLAKRETLETSGRHLGGDEGRREERPGRAEAG